VTRPIWTSVEYAPGCGVDLYAADESDRRADRAAYDADRATRRDLTRPEPAPLPAPLAVRQRPLFSR
jgi:hypothetical protein